ncbi:MAG: hydrogen gas-evolving membrane-bound hydrogenase subunit E [Vicinamibacterales bacterium]
MIATLSVFDAVLATTIVVVAVRVLTAPDHLQAIVVFIVFGLLLSLAWTRLHAVDVALAEAAIGAGLTGALLLNTLGAAPDREATDRVPRGPRLLRLPMLVLATCVGMVVASLVLGTAADGVGLRDAVATALGESGVSNPVTAVLLNFRAYDTLLEIAVLMLAAIGVWSVAPSVNTTPVERRSSPILMAFVRTLIPVMGLVAAFLLWRGSAAPGGAFQAGAVLCAAGVMVVVTGVGRGPRPGHLVDRVAIALGFSAFLALSLGVMREHRRFLEFPRDLAGPLILLLETLLAISIAGILVALFAGDDATAARAEHRSGPEAGA